jgi:uncharacterized membrane protein
MKLSEQIGIELVGTVLCAGGILCFVVAIIKEGTWAIAGSILVFAWVYLNVSISREHRSEKDRLNKVADNNGS